LRSGSPVLPNSKGGQDLANSLPFVTAGVIVSASSEVRSRGISPIHRRIGGPTTPPVTADSPTTPTAIKKIASNSASDKDAAPDSHQSLSGAFSSSGFSLTLNHRVRRLIQLVDILTGSP